MLVGVGGFLSSVKGDIPARVKFNRVFCLKTPMRAMRQNQNSSEAAHKTTTMSRKTLKRYIKLRGTAELSDNSLRAELFMSHF